MREVEEKGGILVREGRIAVVGWIRGRIKAVVKVKTKHHYGGFDGGGHGTVNQIWQQK